MERHRPALLGGVFIGVLSALPIVNAGNCCCCLWVVVGGLLTVYLQQQRVDGPIETADAVLGGLIAGAIGAVIATVLNIALAPLVGPMTQQMVMRFIESANLSPEVRDQFEQISRQGQLATASGHILNFFIMLPVYVIFGMLGGLLGLAFFRKKTPPSVPPVVVQ